MLKYSLYTRKFYIRRNNNKVSSTETGRIGIADLPEVIQKSECKHAFLINDEKILSPLRNL